MNDTAAPRIVGLISGTSADGIDATLVEFTPAIRVIATDTLAYPATLGERVRAALANPATLSLRDYGTLDAAIGDAFGDAARTFAASTGTPLSAITAIASHGQTMYHAPDATPAFTLQAGNAHRIAAATGRPVIADLRGADLAVGGEGAPLAPLLHAAMLASTGETRAVINLGGIANVSILGRDGSVSGWDTGPANTLMDAWAAAILDSPFDRDGALAAQGTVDATLLARLLEDPYFAVAPPKSTGRETFNAQWLARCLGVTDLTEAARQSGRGADIMATLCELSAVTVADAVRTAAPAVDRVLVCGGGAANPTLMRRLSDRVDVPVRDTSADGLDPDGVEAVLVAWLGFQRWQGRTVDTTPITGARQPIRAGSIVLPPGGARE